MSFWASEKSLASGVPYELHEFQLGSSSTYWRYAAAPADIDYGGNTFSAVYIEGGRIEQGVNAIKSRTTVMVNWDNAFAWQYTVCATDDIVHYTRYKGHGSDVAAIYVGDVVDVAFHQLNRRGNRRAEITIDPSTAAEERMGLVSRYSRQCTVEIYSTQCGVLRASYKTSGTLSSVSGNVLTSATFGGQADTWWDGGDIIIGSYRRKMFAHTGNNVTINPAIPNLAGTEDFDAYPGCDHLHATCNSKFSNRDNFKGQPNIPDRDPFSQWGIL
jgi:hypothetical protein